MKCQWVTGFISEEDGSSSVGWVVLAAGVVGLAIGVTSTVHQASTGHGEAIDEAFDARGIPDFGVSGGSASGDSL